MNFNRFKIFSLYNSMGLFFTYLITLGSPNLLLATDYQGLGKELYNKIMQKTEGSYSQNYPNGDTPLFDNFTKGDWAVLVDNVWIDKKNENKATFSLDKRVYQKASNPEDGSCELTSFFQMDSKGRKIYEFEEQLILLKGTKLELVSLNKEVQSPWNVLSQDRINNVTLVFSLYDVPELYLQIVCSAGAGIGGFFVKQPLKSVSDLIFVHIEKPWLDD